MNPFLVTPYPRPCNNYFICISKNSQWVAKKVEYRTCKTKHQECRVGAFVPIILFKIALYIKQNLDENRQRLTLPDPVTAQAQISRPSRATGIVAAWIGVGFSKFSMESDCT